MDPLAKAYMKVISEATEDLTSPSSHSVKTDLTVGAPFGHKSNEKPAKTFINKSGPESVEDVEDPENAPSELTSAGADGEVKKNESPYKESKNPFMALYNRILSENEGMDMDFSAPSDTDGTPENSTFEPSIEHDDKSSDDDTFSDDSSDEVTLKIDRETAEKLIDLLHSAIGDGSDDSSHDDSDDFENLGDDDSSDDDLSDDESEEKSEEPKLEAVDAEYEGHALVDQEKLQHGLNSKGNYTVKGAVPVTNKAAQTPKGPKVDGKLKAHSTEPAISKLTSKSNDTGGVKVGKTLFDNE